MFLGAVIGCGGADSTPPADPPAPGGGSDTAPSDPAAGSDTAPAEGGGEEAADPPAEGGGE